MKINNGETYEGIVSERQVNDYGNANDYALSIDYDTIENIFWKYRKRKIRIQITELPMDNNEED